MITQLCDTVRCTTLICCSFQMKLVPACTPTAAHNALKPDTSMSTHQHTNALVKLHCTTSRSSCHMHAASTFEHRCMVSCQLANLHHKQTQINHSGISPYQCYKWASAYKLWQHRQQWQARIAACYLIISQIQPEKYDFFQQVGIPTAGTQHRLN